MSFLKIIATSLPGEVRTTAILESVCLFVSQLAYLKNRMSKLREIFSVHVTGGLGLSSDEPRVQRTHFRRERVRPLRIVSKAYLL